MDDATVTIYPDPDSAPEPIFALEVGDFDTILLSREERDMFVALHSEAMDRDDVVFSFNQDAPKFRMTLSGDEGLDTDVELE